MQNFKMLLEKLVTGSITEEETNALLKAATENEEVKNELLFTIELDKTFEAKERAKFKAFIDTIEPKNDNNDDDEPTEKCLTGLAGLEAEFDDLGIDLDDELFHDNTNHATQEFLKQELLKTDKTTPHQSTDSYNLFLGRWGILVFSILSILGVSLLASYGSSPDKETANIETEEYMEFDIPKFDMIIFQTNDELLQLGINAYNTDAFDSAKIYFQDYINIKADERAKFYQAVSNLKLENIKEAEPQLVKLSQNENSKFQGAALLYLSYIEMKKNNLSNAVLILDKLAEKQPELDIYIEEGNEILNSLRKEEELN